MTDINNKQSDREAVTDEIQEHNRCIQQKIDVALKRLADYDYFVVDNVTHAIEEAVPDFHRKYTLEHSNAAKGTDSNRICLLVERGGKGWVVPRHDNADKAYIELDNHDALIVWCDALRSAANMERDVAIRTVFHCDHSDLLVKAIAHNAGIEEYK